MGRTNKARLAVCSKAIIKREYLAFVFFSRLDGYNQTLLLGGEWQWLHAIPGLFVRTRDVISAQCYSKVLENFTNIVYQSICMKP